MSVLSRPEFYDEAKAFEHLERIIWNGEPVCPHCGCASRITKVKANVEKRVRLGLWRCGDCKKQFTVKFGTVFEHARIPLNIMLQAIYLMTSSKKGVSAHQLHRILEITYKSAWYLTHRIREAVRSGDLAPSGGDGGFVTIDEPFDEASRCRTISREFVGHDFVSHGHGRGPVHANTIEGYSSIFKRGMKGVYQPAVRSTCTAIWPSSVSSSATAKPTASTTRLVPSRLSRVSYASGSHMGQLTDSPCRPL